MDKTTFAGVTVILMSILSLGSTLADEHFALATDRARDHSRLHKAGPRSKGDSALAEALAEYIGHVDAAKSTTFRPSNKFLQVVAGKILIDARATQDGNVLLSDLMNLGLTNGSQYGEVVSGLLPFAALESALALPSLRSMSASPRPISHAGSITSQGDVALRSDVGRTTYGVDGTGVTVIRRPANSRSSGAEW
jgi:hypothetical protein